jgi:signal transduction histidine kinase
MRKVALVFIVAVFVPSLVLAWLAVRSLRDQEYLLQRQRSLLYQGVADAVANDAQTILTSSQRQFTEIVGTLLRETNSGSPILTFDDRLRKQWPLAQVGFVVTVPGEILCPSASGRPEAQVFCANYGKFLSCRESAEVYWNDPSQQGNSKPIATDREVATDNTLQNNGSLFNSSLAPNGEVENSEKKWYQNKLKQMRNVMPQQQIQAPMKGPLDQAQSLSKIAASEAEFCQLIGASSDGLLARFVDNKMNLLFWFRPPDHRQLVFGAQLALPNLVEALKGGLQRVDPGLSEEACIALLDDTAKPVALSHPGFHGAWKRPFVATEIGEALPHWEVAVYLLNPARLTQSARTLKLTLGLVIALLVLAIGIGSWLIVIDLKRQLSLARQKTDFVSNVSHELKTPLTSIRMFSEMLAEGRVLDAAKQRSYLGIITAEAGRLTRLINNVLDFTRLDRGEMRYHFEKHDLANAVRETAETYRPHLESTGFQFECSLPNSPVWVNGDRDALSQVIVNLLSNAEKYSDARKEISLRIEQQERPLPCVEVKILDRGAGVPHGCEEKIFEQFFRAHDSLSSGIQGSGLGLTLARQIARAHGGTVEYEPREGGGSVFILRLPLKPV